MTTVLVSNFLLMPLHLLCTCNEQGYLELRCDKQPFRSAEHLLILE
jgi:hypothetical protein